MNDQALTCKASKNSVADRRREERSLLQLLADRHQAVGILDQVLTRSERYVSALDLTPYRPRKSTMANGRFVSKFKKIWLIKGSLVKVDRAVEQRRETLNPGTVTFGGVVDR